MNERPLKRWLLASLVLNLFLVGGVVGGACALVDRRRSASRMPPLRCRPGGCVMRPTNCRASSSAGLSRRPARCAARRAGPSRRHATAAGSVASGRCCAVRSAAVAAALARTRERRHGGACALRGQRGQFAATLSAGGSPEHWPVAWRGAVRSGCRIRAAKALATDVSTALKRSSACNATRDRSEVR